MPPANPPRRILATLVAVVTVAVAVVILFVMAAHRDRDAGHPNSVANCDTPPALK